jgi:hypothetical protein
MAIFGVAWKLRAGSQLLPRTQYKRSSQNSPLRDCLKRGAGDTSSVDLAAVRRPKNYVWEARKATPAQAPIGDFSDSFVAEFSRKFSLLGKSCYILRFNTA